MPALLSAIVAGIVLISLGGFADGSYGVMLKYTRVWHWEHTWLLFSLLAFAIFPWILSASTLRDLPSVLQSAGVHGLGPVLIFGIAWGGGAVLYGVALKFAGLSLSYATVMGLTASIGALAPLVLLHREEMSTLRGWTIIGALVLVIIGVTLCAWAGYLKDRVLASRQKDYSEGTKPQRIMLGMIAAVLSGVLSPMLNLSFAYGSALSDSAVRHGATPILAANLISALALSGGSLVNIGYCGYLITKRETWPVMLAPSFDGILAVIMGVLGPIGTILYGMGSTQLGKLGVVVGWPIMSSMGILSANFWGAATGEWSGTGRKPVLVMVAAVAVLLIAMSILAWANSLE